MLSAEGVDSAQASSLLKRHSHARDPQANGKAKDLTEHEHEYDHEQPQTAKSRTADVMSLDDEGLKS